MAEASSTTINLTDNIGGERREVSGCCGNCTAEHGDVSIKSSFKVILVGDSMVGKTTLQRRLAGKTITTTNYCITISPDFLFIPFKVDNNMIVNFMLWDTRGQERFGEMLYRAYYRDTDIILLVFDVCQRSSFEHLSNWLRISNEEIILSRVGQSSSSPSPSSSTTPSTPPVILIGNKIDKTVMVTPEPPQRHLKHQPREVTIEEATNFAMENNCTYVELSAWTGENCDELNNHLVNIIKDMQQRHQQQYEQRHQQQQQ